MVWGHQIKLTEMVFPEENTEKPNQPETDTNLIFTRHFVWYDHIDQRIRTTVYLFFFFLIFQSFNLFFQINLHFLTY